MYCPTCAAQNADNAQFCRACGADISFLSKAMTRRLPEKEQHTAEKGLRYSFIGAGFLLIAIIILFVAPTPTNWALSFSMLCAAFPLLGSGIAKILYVRKYEQTLGRNIRETQSLTGQSASGGVFVGGPSPNGPATVTGHFTVVCPGAAAAAPAATGRVAFTGANILRWSMAAAALIAIGILFMLGSRRRRGMQA